MSWPTPAPPSWRRRRRAGGGVHFMAGQYWPHGLDRRYAAHDTGSTERLIRLQEAPPGPARTSEEARVGEGVTGERVVDSGFVWRRGPRRICRATPPGQRATGYLELQKCACTAGPHDRPRMPRCGRGDERRGNAQLRRNDFSSCAGSQPATVVRNLFRTVPDAGRALWALERRVSLQRPYSWQGRRDAEPRACACNARRKAGGNGIRGAASGVSGHANLVKRI